ncbi:Thioredoxin domain-containing protein 15 [Bulinus truncatus]|nr:Thioredoxin domain-containing protein 15 [Bulinus truncatus]
MACTDALSVRYLLTLSILVLTCRLNSHAVLSEKLSDNHCVEDCIDVDATLSKWHDIDKTYTAEEPEAKEIVFQTLEHENQVVDVKRDFQIRDDSYKASSNIEDNSPLKEVESNNKQNEEFMYLPNSKEQFFTDDSIVNKEKITFETAKVDSVLKLDNSYDNTEQDEIDEEDEQDSEQTPQRRRYFPLLYTFRTLLNSFLSDFGVDSGSQDSSYNATDTTNGSLIVNEDLIKDLNTTLNGTDASKKTRFQCAVKNITASTQGKVKIVNSTELLEILNFSKNQKVSTCVLVMFYAPWCHFCARTAPHYNALARAFPQLDVLAVDTSHFSYLNARFGTVAVPNVMLFHSRSAVRFNHTSRVLENFCQFVTNNTGLMPDKYVKLEPTDFVGPLPSIVVRGRDWLLWLSWTFVISCSLYSFVRSHYGQNCISRLRVLWQEHQHIE